MRGLGPDSVPAIIMFIGSVAAGFLSHRSPGEMLLIRRGLGRWCRRRGVGGLLGGRFFLAGHAQDREKIEYLILVDQVYTFGVQTDEVSAVFAVISAHAGIDAEQICVRAIDALPEGNTDLRHHDFACITDNKEIVAFNVILALGQILVLFDEAKNPASHKNVRMLALIGLDFFQAFIHPVDAVFALNHGRCFLCNVLEYLPAYRDLVAGAGDKPTSSANSFSDCRAAKSASFLANIRLS